MKRDMELVRKLLLHIEENCTYEGTHSPEIEIVGYSEELIGYNLKLMVDGGLIDVLDATAGGDETNYYVIEGITWNGHEFLDSIRDEGAWNSVKAALKPVGTGTFEIIKSLAVAYLSKQVGLP